ncbi:hypothetical protein MKX08_001307 [Trichoderma sp. CBMAI-0020]|nr:hypothetical protein MKX08_001307 [Trichoderma sp. CBMAI-0020]
MLLTIEGLMEYVMLVLLIKAIKTKKSATKDIKKLIKRQPPPIFNRKTNKLHNFQTQLKAYFINFKNTINTKTKKVSFTATYLKETTLK